MKTYDGINRAAPVIGIRETEIAADREVVWEVLTAITDWPRWNPDVKAVTMHTAVSEGAEFRWKAGPGTITSVLEQVQRPTRLGWNGTSFGLKAVHTYVLEAREGATLVRTEESYDGLVARLFRTRLQRTLDGTLERGLRYLKAEAGRRNSGSG